MMPLEPRLSAELLQVKSSRHQGSSGLLMPTISHNGIAYAVADPGTEFEVQAKVLNATLGQLYRVSVKLDGQSVGYSKVVLCCQPYGIGCSFQGFVHTHPSTGHLYYKAFKLAALKPAAGAATVEHPDQIQAGRIEVACEEVVELPGEHDPVCTNPKWGTDAVNKKLPEGKKWFLQPGLQAEEGSTVKQTNQGWDRKMYSTVRALPPLRLRYDTADNLRLRKILDPSKPQHAAILARASGTAGSSSMAGSSRQVKQERRTAGVKRERGADQQRGQQAAAGGADVEVPRSATAETINLVDDAPAPLRVGGRALAADELAVCNLAGSDDEAEPTWQVQKKQAIQVAL